MFFTIPSIITTIKISVHQQNIAFPTATNTTNSETNHDAMRIACRKLKIAVNACHIIVSQLEI